MEQIPRSDFLFSKTGFLIGLGSVINIAGSYYSFNGSRSGQEADERALSCDWAMVAEDLRGAMRKVDEGDPKQLLLPLA